MSFYVWVILVFVSVVIVWFSLYAHNKQWYRRRAVTNVPAGTRIVNANNTVIYTIPTTQQLAATYPTLTQSSRPMSIPPAYDMPPTYDQVIIMPSVTSTTTAGTTTRIN